MTDLRTLLHDAAPEPRRELDVAEIHERAVTYRRRRLVAWLGGLGLLVGAGLPLGGAVLQPGTDAATDLAIRRTPAVVEQTATSLEAARAPADGGGTNGAGSTGARAAIRASGATPGERPPASVEGSIRAPAVAGTSGVAPVGGAVAGFPLANDCYVDNAGLGPSEARVCRFEAMRRGGASVHAEPSTASTAGVETTVRVTHEGTTTAYRIGQNSVDAGDFRAFVGCQFVIEPGDLVEVELVNAPAPTNGRTTLGAGEGWGC